MQFLYDYPTLAKLVQAFPQIRNLPLLAGKNSADMSAEFRKLSKGTKIYSTLAKKYGVENLFHGLRILQGSLGQTRETKKNRYALSNRKLISNNIILKYGDKYNQGSGPDKMLQQKIIDAIKLSRKVTLNACRFIAIRGSHLNLPEVDLLTETMIYHFGCEPHDPLTQFIASNFHVIRNGLDGLLMISDLNPNDYKIISEGHVYHSYLTSDDNKDLKSPFHNGIYIENLCGNYKKNYRAHLEKEREDLFETAKENGYTIEEFLDAMVEETDYIISQNIHIDFSINCNGKEKIPNRAALILYLAHLIIHEATHKFIATHDHAYTHDNCYGSLGKELRLYNADSYANAMMSFYLEKNILETSDMWE